MSGASFVLVSSAGAKLPLIRALKAAAARLDPDLKVMAADIDPLAPSRYHADAFLLTPRLGGLPPEELAELLVANGVRAVLPTRDGELAYFARARPFLADAGIAVIVSPPEGVDLCLDKLAFSRRLAAAGLPVIPAEDRPEAVAAERLVVKERFGAGSRGLGLDLDRDQAARHAAHLADPIFQPFVSGPEISVDAFIRPDGRPHGLVLRRRDKVANGESVITTTFSDASLEAAAAQVLTSVGLQGPVVLQAILAAGGGLSVIECNARFGGASTASIAVGLDLLFWSLQTAFGSPLSPFVRATGEVRQVRGPTDLILHDPHL